MKVLFVYRFLTLGGVETVLRARLDGLDEWPIDAHCWFLDEVDGRSIFSGLEGQVRIGGLAELEAHLKVAAYDLVSTIDTEEIFPLLQRASPDSIVVVEAHTPYLENLEYLRNLRQEHIAAFWVPTNYQALRVKERVDRQAPIKIVPNPLRDIFAAPPEVFGALPVHPIVAWIGRLDELKNWREFIDAAAVLAGRGHEVEFWLAARSLGPKSVAGLYRKAKEAGVLGRLRWFKNLPNERMPRWLDAVRGSSGVVVSTSRGESFGMTIAEAMARECAVVVPDFGPFQEFVRHSEVGRAYEPGSPESAADQIGALLADRKAQQAIGKRARASILERHAPENAIGALAHNLLQIGRCDGNGSGSVPTAQLGVTFG